MIDFLEPRGADKIIRLFGCFGRDASRSTRVTMAVVALLLAAFSVEGFRICAAWQTTLHWELQRDRDSQMLLAFERRGRANALERHTFASLVQLRAQSAAQARHLATLGNAIGSHAGLVSLHRSADGIEVEGRARTVEDVALAIGRLQRSESGRSATLVLKRDDSDSGFVWFRLGLHR